MFIHPGLPRFPPLVSSVYFLPPQAWVTHIFFSLRRVTAYIYHTMPGVSIYFTNLGWVLVYFFHPEWVTAFLFTVHHAWCLHIIYPPWRVLHIFIHPGGGCA